MKGHLINEETNGADFMGVNLVFGGHGCCGFAQATHICHRLVHLRLDELLAHSVDRLN